MPPSGKLGLGVKTGIDARAWVGFGTGVEQSKHRARNLMSRVNVRGTVRVTIKSSVRITIRVRPVRSLSLPGGAVPKVRAGLRYELSVKAMVQVRVGVGATVRFLLWLPPALSCSLLALTLCLCVRVRV